MERLYERRIRRRLPVSIEERELLRTPARSRDIRQVCESVRRRKRLYRQVRGLSAAGLCFHGDAGGVRRRTDGQGKARALFFRGHIDFMVGLPPERHFQSRPVRLQTESVKGRVRKRTFDRTKKTSRTEKRKGETDRRHRVPRSQADTVAAAGVTQQQQNKE